MNSRLLSSRGRVLRGGMGTHGMTGGDGMGPRLREDNGRGAGLEVEGFRALGKPFRGNPCPSPVAESGVTHY